MNTNIQTTNLFLWSKVLDVQMHEDTWWSLYPNFVKYIRPAKLQDFQFRLLQRALTTNIIRNKWNETVSLKCTFCKMTNETLIYLLCNCDCVKKLWMAMEKLCKTLIQVNVKINNEIVIFNNYQGPQKQIVNLMVIIMKQHIYASKCFEKIPIFTDYVQT